MKITIVTVVKNHCILHGHVCVMMATVMQMDERIVDYLVLDPNNQDRKVSAKSMTMRGTTF